MRTKQWLAATLVAFGLGMPAAAWAQPETKLVDGLDQEAIEGMWCSAVLFEKSFWYDDDVPMATYYDEVSLELELIAREVMEAEGWSRARQDALWETYDGAAFDVAQAEDGSFSQFVRDCEAAYGHLVARPKK